MIQPQNLLATDFPEVTHTYTARDTMLYALGIGFGIDPLDTAQLPFVTEGALRVTPTMAVVMAYLRGWYLTTGIDYLRVVHASERIVLHRQLPTAGTVVGRMRVVAVIDKGADKGALVVSERAIRDAATGAKLADVQQVAFCRGDGGCGSAGPALPSPMRMPDRAPDAVCTLPTQPQTALIYRLSGDMNPLHSDPATAARAGFPRPILHGLATYGVIGHALLRTQCGFDPARLHGIACRFTSPVFPGETIRTEIWRDGNAAQFRALVDERVVADSGSAAIGDPLPQ